MSWLDGSLGNNGPGGVTQQQQLTVSQLTPEQLNWFASHGINPTTFQPAQLLIGVTQANADIQAQQQAAQQKTAADKAAADKAAADAAAQQQAQVEADARAKALADAQAAADAKAKDIPPAPTMPQQQVTVPNNVPPTVPVDPNAYILQNQPTGPTQDDINKMITDAVTKALSDQQTQLTTQFQTQSDQAKQAEDAAARAETERLAGLRNATSAGTDTGIRSYFQARGVDPTQYDQQIKDSVSQALCNVSPSDTNPSARVDVTGLASNLYTSDENARRTAMLNAIAQMFPDTFVNKRVTNDLATPFIDETLGGQRTNAEAIVRNMLTRGVINQTGADAALNDLKNQDPVARARLLTVSNDLLGGERSSINDIINRANQAASTLKLSGTFDPNAYKDEIDKSFNDFVGSLGTKIKASAPGNLYTTSGLGAIAGSAQGAGNTQFNPNALAGVLEQQTDDATKSGNRPTSSRAVTDFVF